MFLNQLILSNVCLCYKHGLLLESNILVNMALYKELFSHRQRQLLNRGHAASVYSPQLRSPAVVIPDSPGCLVGELAVMLPAR